jgi:amylosucrase
MTTDIPLARLLAELPHELHAEARARYGAHQAVLRGRLERLYGRQSGFEAWLGELLAAVGRLYAERPEALRALDRERAADPGWFTRPAMLGYSAYVDQFGGTLRGVQERIEHLRALGVSYLHLLPFLKARAGASDGGFAVASFDEVEPRFGSNEDLLALTQALRGAGISLCSDLILNHVADDHPWAQAAKAGDPAMRAFFHIYPDRSEPDAYEATLGQVFPQAAPGNFTQVAQLDGWVWTTFYPFQWDLNYANPEVFSAMACAMLRLANRGVEVFRLDSTAFLWKRLGTSCMNQPEAHLILQALRAIVEIAAPGVLLKAEAIVPTADLPAYFGEEGAPECHLAYHSTLMAAGWAALAEQDTGALRLVAGGTPALPAHTSWLTYVRCHDDIGWTVLRGELPDPARRAAIARFFAGEGFAAGVPFQDAGAAEIYATNGSAASLAGFERAASEQEREDALRRLLLVHGLAMSFGGLPVLYMGDELAMLNDYSYRADASRVDDSRWVQRAPFDAQRLQGDAVAARVYHALRSLAARRARIAGLAAGGPCAVLPARDPAVLALLREGLLNLSNFSARTVEVSLAELGAGSWPGQHDAVTLGPWEMLWLERPLQSEQGDNDGAV